MYNKLEFTLDNIIYNTTIRENENLEIILPCKNSITKVCKSEYTNEKVNLVVEPVVQVKIKLFVVTKSFVPDLYIHGEKKEARLNYTEKIQLKANTTTMLTFTTTNGGNDWLISSTEFSLNPQPQPGPGGSSVESVNGQSGVVILDASQIHLKEDKGPTIVQQFENVEHQILNLETTIVSDVTDEVVTMLPGMIKTELGDTIIVADII